MNLLSTSHIPCVQSCFRCCWICGQIVLRKISRSRTKQLIIECFLCFLVLNFSSFPSFDPTMVFWQKNNVSVFRDSCLSKWSLWQLGTSGTSRIELLIAHKHSKELRNCWNQRVTQFKKTCQTWSNLICVQFHNNKTKFKRQIVASIKNQIIMKKKNMVCMGFKPAAAGTNGWKTQTNTLS